MEKMKRTILREDFISRESGSGYGRVNKPFVYLNFMLTQDIDDMGVFGDYPFIESETEQGQVDDIQKGKRPQFQKKKWFKVGTKTQVNTDSKLINLKGYKNEDRYKVGFDNHKETYIDFSKHEINGVSRITEKSSDKTVYVVDANNDGYLGSESQRTGLRYVDYSTGETMVDYIPQGVNDTNSSLSAISKEEYLMGIISTPEIKNDIFIERGELSVTEPHLRLSEVETLEHLMKYGNGYYNVVK